MKFEESGLPKNEMIERAFDYSRGFLKTEFNERTCDYSTMLQAQLAVEVRRMRDEFSGGRLSRQEYESCMAQAPDHLKRAELQERRVIDQRLNAEFTTFRLHPARIVAEQGFTSAQIAATLLRGCLRSPTDVVKVDRLLGPAVMPLAVELWDVEAYPRERLDRLPTASLPLRQILMCCVISTVAQVGEHLSDKEKIFLAPDAEQRLVDQMRAMRGTSRELEDVFMRVMNALGDKNPTGRFKVARDGADDLYLQGRAERDSVPVDLDDILGNIAPKGGRAGPAPV